VEKTLVLIKPDAVQRGLVGEIIRRMEQRGLKILSMKMVQVSREFAEKHYAEHIGKGFFDGLIEYITSSPLVALVCEAPGAVQAVRQMAGKTNPLEAAPGSIRHDLGLTVGRNLIHASDSQESAKKEIALWFEADEITTWHRITDEWIYENN
jgi:nucleoside-diphosphate kinase